MTFNVGEEVMLSTKNLQPKDRRLARKFLPRFMGPFPIEEVVSNRAYRLKLPSSLQIHPVFHVSLLKRYVPSERSSQPNSVPTPIHVDGELEWEVEAILNHRKRQGINEYLIKWRGFPKYENTWELESNLHNCQEILKEYWHSHFQSRNGSNRASSRQK